MFLKLFKIELNFYSFFIGDSIYYENFYKKITIDSLSLKKISQLNTFL